MGRNTAIEWAHHTFNPWWGCTKVSDECANCYADAFSHRLGHDVWGPGAPRRFFGDKHWAEPEKWNRDAGERGVRERVFCASMADVFEDRRDLDAERVRLWALIERTPHLDWLLLTKRPEKVLELMPARWRASHTMAGDSNIPPNVWVGASAGNQAAADVRLPELVKIPAPVIFVSCEPMLGEVDLTPWLDPPCDSDSEGVHHVGCGCERGSNIDWVIAGGESGGNARPMHPRWAERLRDQCVAADVPFLFKQWGEWAPNCLCPRRRPCKTIDRPGYPSGVMFRCGKKYSGRKLNRAGRHETWDEVPS